MTTIYVARHGESETNHQRLITGQLDPGLSPHGREQSEALARALANEPLAAIYTSALLRTRQTAAPTATLKNLPTTALPALNEIHLGTLQGRYRDERDPQAAALYAQWQAAPWDQPAPQGESFDDLLARASEALSELLQRHAGQTILIVGHRATNRVLLGTLLDWPRERWREIRQRNKFFYCVQPGAVPSVTSISLSGSKEGLRQDGFIQ